MKDNRYGFGENPPYSLYQGSDGKWGLVDGSGQKLDAVLKKGNNDCFSCVPWEVVTFDEKEGFELQCWYDPCEVWFNFTWEDPAYPEEFGGYMWKRFERNFAYYSQLLFSKLPNEYHWLVEALYQNDMFRQRINDDNEYESWIKNLIETHLEVKNASITNKMIDNIMRDNTIDQDLKCTLWQAKVSLDYNIRYYLEDND